MLKTDVNAASIELTVDYMPIPKVFSKQAVAISFCSSDKYAPFCGITIESIIENSSSEYNYDIFIMEFDISNANKTKILSLIEGKKNFSIRYINMNQVLNKIKVNTWAHFSPVACFKLFLLSPAFSNYEKILALDTDLIFARDAEKLFSYDLGNCYMGAVDDVIMKGHVSRDKKTSGYAPTMPVRQYISEYLGFGTDENYYNTGVALINLKACQGLNLLDKALQKLYVKGYTYQEQDILNELFAGHILDIDCKWNVVGIEQTEKIKEGLSKDLIEKYEESLENPYVIHFAGGFKPWIYNNAPYSEYFFKYAKNTPWFVNIVAGMTINYTNYIRANILSTINQEKGFRVKLKKFIIKIFPVKSIRGKIIRKMFPRGKGIREWLRETYNNIIEKTQGKDKIAQVEHENLLKLHGIYNRALKKPIIKNAVLLDSKNGTDLAGNVFRILAEIIKPEYNLKVYLSTTKDAAVHITNILRNYQLHDMVTLIEWRSKKYFTCLARAKYLVTDLYMPSEFIKREEQILISTAHGTPIKVMGKDCHTETQGHLQRTHTMADYQTFPSVYMKEKLFSAFMEDNFFKGHALKSGYCRNDIFFNRERRGEIRRMLGFQGKTIYAYLPTFRGIGGDFHSQKQANEIKEFCDELDLLMTDEQVLIVKFHNFSKINMDFGRYKHIIDFSFNYEVYDILNATDCLISDYSSVFFDYANTKNKIILFQYDYSEYKKERGVYLDWADLPFPVVSDINGLYKEMCSPIQYDDTDFLKKYCTFDSDNSTYRVCQTIFKQRKLCEEFDLSDNGKKNILIYAGNFDLKKPATFFAIEYLKRLDLEKNNYILFFYEYDLFSRAYILEQLPQSVNYFSFLEYPAFSKKEEQLWHKKKYEKLKPAFQREVKKIFGNLRVDMFIDFYGENQVINQLAGCLTCKVYNIKTIDMAEELRLDNSELISQWPGEIVELSQGYSKEILDENVATLKRSIKL